MEKKKFFIAMCLLAIFGHYIGQSRLGANNWSVDNLCYVLLVNQFARHRSVKTLKGIIK